MKIIFLELLKGLFLAACFLVFCLILATCSRSVYSKDLSKIQSDSSHRKSDFFVPKFCKASQAVQKTSASVSATQTRLYSLYEGMTQQNKPMANMLGGYFEAESESPHQFYIGENLNSKIQGGIAHA